MRQNGVHQQPRKERGMQRSELIKMMNQLSLSKCFPLVPLSLKTDEMVTHADVLQEEQKYPHVQAQTSASASRARQTSRSRSQPQALRATRSNKYLTHVKWADATGRQ